MDGTEIKVENGYIYIKTPATRSLLTSLGMLTGKATKISKRYAEDSDATVIIDFAEAHILYDNTLKTKASDIYNKFIATTGRLDISIVKLGRVFASELGLRSKLITADGLTHRVYKGVALK